MRRRALQAVVTACRALFSFFFLDKRRVLTQDLVVIRQILKVPKINERGGREDGIGRKNP